MRKASIDLDERCFHTVYMEWIWMNNELSPLQCGGEQMWIINTFRERKLFKETSSLKKKGQVRLPLRFFKKGHLENHSDAVVHCWLKGVAGRIIDAAITQYHDSAVWRRQV